MSSYTTIHSGDIDTITFEVVFVNQTLYLGKPHAKLAAVFLECKVNFSTVCLWFHKHFNYPARNVMMEDVNISDFKEFNDIKLT